MGTLNRAFRKIKNWLTSPGKTFGTGMPTSRTIPEPVFAEPSIESQSTDCDLKKRSHNRVRDAMQRASRKRNR